MITKNTIKYLLNLGKGRFSAGVFLPAVLLIFPVSSLAETVVFTDSHRAEWTDGGWSSENTLNSITKLPGNTGYIFNLTIDRTAEAGGWDEMCIGQRKDILSKLKGGGIWKITVHNPHTNEYPFAIQGYCKDHASNWFLLGPKVTWVDPGQSCTLSHTINPGHTPLQGLGLQVGCAGWTGAPEVYTFDLIVTHPETVISYIAENSDENGLLRVPEIASSSVSAESQASDTDTASARVLVGSELNNWKDPGWKAGNTLNSKTELPGNTGYLYNLTIDRTEEGDWDDLAIIQVTDLPSLKDGDTWEVTIFSPPTNLFPFYVSAFYYDKDRKLRQSKSSWVHPGKTVKTTSTIASGHAPVTSLGLMLGTHRSTRAPEVFTFDVGLIDCEAVQTYIAENPGNTGLFSNFNVKVPTMMPARKPLPADGTIDLTATLNLIKANHLISNNDLVGADEAINTIFAHCGQDANLTNVIGGIAQKYYEGGKNDRIIQLCQRELNDNPSLDNLSVIHRRLAQAHLRQGNDVQAEQHVTKILTKCKDDKRLCYNLFLVGEEYYRKGLAEFKKEGNSAAGQTYLSQTITIMEGLQVLLGEPRNNQNVIAMGSLRTLGYCYQLLGQYEKALDRYEKLLTDWPNYHDAAHVYYSMGKVYEKWRETGGLADEEAGIKARDAYETILAKYPESTVVRAAKLRLKQLKKSK